MLRLPHSDFLSSINQGHPTNAKLPEVLACSKFPATLMNANFGRAIEILSSPLTTYEMETLPGVAPPEQQNTYFYIGQHETKRSVPVTTELGNQAQDAGVSF
jgi:hypothetical protein